MLMLDAIIVHLAHHDHHQHHKQTRYCKERREKRVGRATSAGNDESLSKPKEALALLNELEVDWRAPERIQI